MAVFVEAQHPRDWRGRFVEKVGGERMYVSPEDVPGDSHRFALTDKQGAFWKDAGPNPAEVMERVMGFAPEDEAQADERQLVVGSYRDGVIDAHGPDSAEHTTLFRLAEMYPQAESVNWNGERLFEREQNPAGDEELYRYLTGQEMPENPREAFEGLSNNIDFDKIANVDGDAFNALFDRLEAQAAEREAADVASEQDERGAAIRSAAEGPVSKAFNVRDLPRYVAVDVSDALDAIDVVHSDGELDPVPLEADSDMTSEGEHVIKAGTGERIIRLNPNADSPHLTAAHEIGHLLDRQVLAPDKDGWASESNSPLVQGWRDAVFSSGAFSRLRELLLAEGEVDGFSPDKRYLAYLTRENELFARSYAQYIAQRSGNESLRLGVDQRRQTPPRTLHYPTQWDDDDFAPIAQAFDEMFTERGWR